MAASSKSSSVQRTLVLRRPDAALESVCVALGLQAKNLLNTAIFAVRQVMTAYDRADAGNYTLRLDLHGNQVVALERFSDAIERINAARAAKSDEPNLIASLEPEVESLVRSVLDPTVLDNVLRSWPNRDGECVYGRLPAKAAQQVLRRLKDMWSGYFAALAEFDRGNAAMRGRPQPPDYLGKHDHFVVELPLTQTGECLVNLGERNIPVAFSETVSLDEVQLAAWNGYRVQDAVSLAAKRRGYESAKVQHLRIVPMRRGTRDSVKLEAVVRLPRSLPGGSFLGKAEVELADALEDAKSASKRNKLFEQWLASQPLPAAVAGIDPGVSNTLTVAYSTGHRAHIVTSGRLEAILTDIDQRIDHKIATLVPNEIKELQQRKAQLQENGECLSREDERRLRKALKDVHRDPALAALRQRRSRWLSDYAHKLTRGVVDRCVERGVQVIVVGQNKGLKNEADLGKAQNRRMHRIPHHLLLELIRYKAAERGLLVVSTEESYTSKTSFVNNEPLRTKAAASASATQVATEPAPAHIAQGKRLKHERHTFVNHKQTGRWARVHADVNAAFNIIRKIFKSFAFHAKLTLKYQLLRLSPRLGLAAVRI